MGDDSSSSLIGGAKSENDDKSGASSTTTTTSIIPPGSPEELLSRIRDDYVVYNYLWTGDIYTPAFEKDCRFTDPTLSFVGTDTFVSNVQNLKPIIDTLATGCKSDLLDICINEEEGYIESRWNMIGDLSGLPWKPRIDVIGRTKFWYRQVTDEGEDGVAGFRVFFYDEKWEMPAGKALLQLVTPTW
uniref:SnoaL-like domain-containing protein n=1 Tax=Leptocylindrus danicus TaxID=163516 RepID=A0A7S2K149_9STRA